MDYLDLHLFVRSTVIDKVHGVITGSALGDCIGLYTGKDDLHCDIQDHRLKFKSTEFLSKQTAEEIYGESKFSLLEPVTKMHGDNHRGELC